MTNFLLENVFLMVMHPKIRIPHHSFNYLYSYGEAQESSFQALSANLWLNCGYKYVQKTISTRIHTHRHTAI